jgi:quercetin dioxygenase-like cupin family protein
MSVRTLAANAGFSPSFISQVENGQASPSISSLEKIANALGVRLADFFNALKPRAAAVTRASSRRLLTSGWSKAKLELLGPTGSTVAMQAVLVTLAAGGSSGSKPSPPAAEEFAFVLEGELTLTMGGDEYLLSVGDSATIPAGEPRRLQNRGTTPVRIIIVSAKAGP